MEREFGFSIDAVSRTKLLAGRDDIDQTLQYGDRISEFAVNYAARHPWLKTGT